MFSKFRQPNRLLNSLHKLGKYVHLETKIIFGIATFQKTTKHWKLPTPQIEIHLNLQLWSPLPSTSLETKVPNHLTLESFKFEGLEECDFRHLETELVCYNASLYHVRMLLFSIEEKNSLATLKWSPITFPCNAKGYRQLGRQLHYHLLYSLTL